jgi:ParB family chromosome partitioning protein
LADGCNEEQINWKIDKKEIVSFRKGLYTMAKQILQDNQDTGFQTIRLDEIDKGPAHIRTHINEEDLEELKDSIKKLGLLQPIVVIRKQKVTSEGKRYNLIIGSRRVLAHEKLGRKKIPAIILEKQNEETILAASLSENLFRSKLSHKDTAAAVTKLYKLYGRDEKKVAKATGIWPATVLRYVYLKEYGTQKMINWVDKGSVKLLDVKRMLQVAQWNIKKAERMLGEMIKEKMTPTQKRNFAEYMKENPSAKIEEAVKDAKNPRILNKILVDLTSELRQGMTKAMKEWKMDPEEIAFQALHDWLEEQGYIE